MIFSDVYFIFGIMLHGVSSLVQFSVINLKTLKMLLVQNGFLFFVGFCDWGEVFSTEESDENLCNFHSNERKSPCFFLFV